MVIWRGWGILAFAYVAVAMIVCLGAASSAVDEKYLPFTAAGGLLVAAIATWFTGYALNVSGPKKKIDAWYGARKQQVDELVRTGRFLLGPGQPPPSSHAEAQAQAEQLLAHERQQANGLMNRHTLFFIPMHYLAPVMAVGAIVLLVVGATGLVNS